MNIGNYLHRYSGDLRLKNYSANTIKNYVSQVGLFLDRFNKQVTDDVVVNEFWNEETLYDGPASGLNDFLANTQYKLGSDGRCLSPVQKLKP